MSKNVGSPPPYTSSPAAPPTYAQAVGGVPPTSPFIPHHGFVGEVRPLTNRSFDKKIMKGPEILTTVVPVGAHRTHMICPHCHAEIETTTKSKPGTIAYIAGTLICLMGCPLGCCLIPCCIDKCMDVHHTCPNCKAYLGRFRR